MVRAQAAMKLPMATVWPDANFHVINCRRFADEVKKATGGAIEIDVKSGGQLGFKGPECLRAVRDGLVPMADYLNTQQIGDEPFMGIEGIPFLAGSRRGAARSCTSTSVPSSRRSRPRTIRRSSMSCRGRTSTSISR